MDKFLIKRLDKVIKIIENKDKVLDNKLYNMKKVLLYGIRPKKQLIKIVKDYLEKNTEYEIIIQEKNNQEDHLKLNEKKKYIILTNKDYHELSEFKKDYFMLDFHRITQNNYYIFATDYEDFDFKKFEKESNLEDYIGIKWKNKNLINIGDIVYIYFFNLPDRLSRLMAKAIVIDDGFHFSIKESSNNELCKYEDKDIKNTAIRIKQLCIFDDLESRLKFNKKRISESPYNISLSNYQPKIAIDNHPDLIEEIENYIKNYSKNNTISYYAKKFGIECYFKDYPEKNFFEYNHKSFIKENGEKHYIIHHLIEQHYARNEIIDNTFVYNPINEIPLCANCHDRIHHGLYNDRKKMVLYIYQQKKEEIDKELNKMSEELFKDIPNYISNKRLYWLLNQYIPDNYIIEEDLKGI